MFFPLLALVAYFPALSTDCMFSPVSHRLHFSLPLAPVASFLALSTGCMFFRAWRLFLFFPRLSLIVLSIFIFINRKSAKAVVILISLLGLIYLLTFYQPTNNPAYNYFVAVVYPLQVYIYHFVQLTYFDTN